MMSLSHATASYLQVSQCSASAPAAPKGPCTAPFSLSHLPLRADSLILLFDFLLPHHVSFANASLPPYCGTRLPCFLALSPVPIHSLRGICLPGSLHEARSAAQLHVLTRALSRKSRDVASTPASRGGGACSGHGPPALSSEAASSQVSITNGHCMLSLPFH